MFGVWGLRSEVWGLGFVVWGLEFVVEGLGFGFGFGVWCGGNLRALEKTSLSSAPCPRPLRADGGGGLSPGGLMAWDLGLGSRV